MFEKLLAAVMSRLGITSFEEKDGKYVLTEEQKVSLAKMYNKDFAEKFEKDLFAMKKEDVDSDNVSAYKKKLNLNTLKSALNVTALALKKVLNP